MQYRSLGRTGVQVSVLCLGSGEARDEGWFEVVDRAIEAGVNFIDTANIYGRGLSEKLLGQALKRNGRRERIVLATKVHGPMSEDDPNAVGLSRRHIIEQCEASLERLQTDHIDLYQLHRPMSQIPIDETLRALDDLVRAGKVRYIGTSTFGAWQIVEALWVAKEYGLNRFVCEQPPYHMLDRRIEREIVPVAQSYGLGLICYSPLAGGFLTGKYRRGQERPVGSKFAVTRDPTTDRHFVDPAFDVVERVEAIAREKSCTASQFCLAWCMSQPGITSCIIGAHTAEQLQDNLRGLEVAVTAEDCRHVDEVARPGRAVVCYYEADFGPSLYRW